MGRDFFVSVRLHFLPALGYQRVIKLLGGLYWGGRRTRYIFWPGFLKIGISGFLKLKPAFALGDADWDRVWRYSTLSSVDIYSLNYYDPNSELFYKSESRLSKLKDEARRRNWDITLDLEDIDFLYK